MQEVAQLSTGQELVAKVVVALAEFVPAVPAGIGGAQQGEAQGAGLGERAGQGREWRIGARGSRGVSDKPCKWGNVSIVRRRHPHEADTRRTARPVAGGLR